MAARDIDATYNLGFRLQQARKALGLSLAQVAAVTGVSASFLSTVEQGKSDISMGRLMKLVRCYRISITDLVDGDAAAPVHVVRSHDRKQLSLAEEGISIFVLAPEGKHAMLPVLNEYLVGGEMTETARHEGDEFIFVLSGELEFRSGDDPPLLLRAGDSAYYAADVPHAFRNPGRDPVRFIGVATPPNF